MSTASFTSCMAEHICCLLLWNLAGTSELCQRSITQARHPGWCAWFKMFLQGSKQLCFLLYSPYNCNAELHRYELRFYSYFQPCFQYVAPCCRSGLSSLIYMININDKKHFVFWHSGNCDFPVDGYLLTISALITNQDLLLR